MDNLPFLLQDLSLLLAVLGRPAVEIEILLTELISI
jgi:hypothetical protein